MSTYDSLFPYDFDGGKWDSISASLRRVVPLADAVRNRGTNPTVQASQVVVSLINDDGTLLDELEAVTCSIYRPGGELVRTVAGTVDGAEVSVVTEPSDFDDFGWVLVNYTVDDVTFPLAGYLHVLEPA